MSSAPSSSPLNKRLQRELQTMTKEPLVGISVDTESMGDEINRWIVKLSGFQGTLYEGENFCLQLKFGSEYPFDSPEVIFTGENIPVHPHIYTNGHICLSILYDNWSPALSVEAICLSILSMLSSCKEKKLPPDNERYVKHCQGSPKKTAWVFHDDSV